MSLSHAELQGVVAELRPLLLGGRLEKAMQPSPTTVVLTLYAHRTKRHLLLATQPGVARLHLVPERPAAPGELPPFARALRQTLRDRRLAAIDLAEGDRIVELAFARGDEPAGRLVAELTGRTSNAYLVGPDGRLRAALRPTRKAGRDLRPGSPYEPPPPPPPSPAAARDRFAASVEAAEAPSYSEAIADLYAQKESRDRLHSLRTALAARLKAARKKALRLLANLEADRGSPDEPDRLRLCGELLKLHLHDLPPRQASVTVPNAFDPDAPPVEIQLRPNLSPRQNMEHYFRRYKKLAATRKQTQARAAATRARIDDLDRLALAVQQADTAEQLEALAADIGHKPPTRRRPRRTDALAGPYRFVSLEGLDILVGRTQAENDQLTFRIARGNDLWLHVEGYAGSHVVVRLPKGKSVPKDTLLDAATLAVHFSQLRKARGGPVAYCACRHVAKPRGAGPGQVLYSQNKLLHIDVEPARLARLMRKDEG